MCFGHCSWWTKMVKPGKSCKRSDGTKGKWAKEHRHVEDETRGQSWAKEKDLNMKIRFYILPSFVPNRKRRGFSPSSTFLTHHTHFANFPFANCGVVVAEWENKSTSFVRSLCQRREEAADSKVEARKWDSISHQAINIFPWYLQRVRN